MKCVILGRHPFPCHIIFTCSKAAPQIIFSAYVEFSLEEKKGEADPVPFQLSIFKGIKSHRLPRAWVRWLLTHPVPQAFVSWAETSALPDEMLVPTLARVSLVLQQEDGSWLVEQEGDLRDPRHLQHWAPDMSCRGGTTIKLIAFFFLQMIFFLISRPMAP